MMKHGQGRGAAIGLIAGASAWLAMGAAYASAARDFAETTVIDAPAGTTTALGDFAVGDREALYKTGAGTLAVEANRLARPSDGRLTVLEGDVAITPGTATDATVPPAACQKAAFWVNPSSLVTTNGVAAGEDAAAPVYAARWCDVRETTPASPTRVYAEPRWFGSEAVPALLDGIDPVVSNYNGRLAVDFGGAQSGQYMHWRLNGADCTLTNVWHLFIVHGVETCGGTPVSDESGGRDKCPFLFALFQGRTASGAFCIPSFDDYKSTTIATDRGDICTPQMSARFFLDGVATDLRTTKPRKGWQLLGADYIDVLPRADNFFRGGFREVIKGAQGGDYLGEVLVFTNRLTVAECAEITRYLLAKWRAPLANADAQSLDFAVRAHGTQVTLAAGTSAAVSGEAGTTTTPLAFAGAGSVTKTGAGTLALGPTDGLALTGDFTWQEGALRLQGGRIPALAVAGGETYAFTTDSHAATPTAAGDAAAGLLCTKTAGAAGVVETTGNGWLRVHTVAPDVRTVKVGIGAADKGAVLQLEGRTRQTAAPEAGPAEATIPNADFEQPFTITTTKFDRSELGDAGINGWKGWGGFLMCVQAPQKSAGGTNTWSQWLNRLPRDGTNILKIVQAGKAYTTVQVPQAGVYELSFDAKSRYTPLTHNYQAGNGFWYDDRQSQIDIQFAQNAGDVWNAAARVGTLPLGSTEFDRFHFRFAVAKAGAWTLGLKSVDYGKDSTAFFDNFRMVRVAEPVRETVQEIPNGGFDRLARGAGTVEDPYVRGRYCTLNKIENWALSVLPGSEFAAVTTNGVIGAITSGMVLNSKVQIFPFASGARGAGALGFCATGGVATTSFTVPAGTWYLRGLVQTLKTYLRVASNDRECDKNPEFRARLTRADGTTVDLGKVTATKHELVPAFWPQAFTVAEAQQVTLTLTQEGHKAFGLVDELSLARAETADFGNLVPGADFESGGWSAYKTPGVAETVFGFAECREYFDRPWHWGYSVWSGLYRLRLQNGHGGACDVAIPEAGRYRFTMHVRARADKDWYANNPVRVWLAKGGVTNVLATTPTLFMRNWIEVSYGATVAEPGTWRLGIEGLCGKVDVVDATTGKVTDYADIDAQIDDVSLVRDLDVRDAAPSLPHGLRFEVAKGATLLLDYTGTATCGPVVYDGTVYTGLITASTHPAFVSGAGALQSIPAGTVFLLR